MLPGIFIPSLTVGGAWGRLIGMLVQACLTSAGSSLRISLPAYTVCAISSTRLSWLSTSSLAPAHTAAAMSALNVGMD